MGLAKGMCVSPKTYRTSHPLFDLGSAALHVHNKPLHLFLLGNGLHIDSRTKIEVEFMREKKNFNGSVFVFSLGAWEMGRSDWQMREKQMGMIADFFIFFF